MVGARSHDPGSKAAPAQCSAHTRLISLSSFVLIMLLVVGVRALLITLMTTLDLNLNHQIGLGMPLFSRNNFWGQDKL